MAGEPAIGGRLTKEPNLMLQQLIGYNPDSIAAAQAIRRAAPAATHAYIIGKGPSLDALAADDFPDASAPVLAVNESIHAIERLGLSNPVFCVQQDAALNETCRPKAATWLLSAQAWKTGKGDACPHAVKYTPAEFGMLTRTLTSAIAMRLARLAGIRDITMLAFDAHFNGNCDYAAAIGHEPVNKNKRFVKFGEMLSGVIAQQNGVRLFWQPPKDFWTVLLVLKTGGSYDWRHVETAKGQIARRIKSPHRVLVLSDDPRGDIPLRQGWPGRISKLEMFDPASALLGGILYLDLANVLGRDIALPPWDKALTPGRLLMWPDPWQFAGRYASSAMAWLGGTVTAPFDVFRDYPVANRPDKRNWSDQHVINLVMGDQCGDIAPLLQVRSYKIDKVKDAGEADVVVFHGTPKPWDVGWLTVTDDDAKPAQPKAPPSYKEFYDAYWEEPAQEGRPSSGLDLVAKYAAGIFKGKKVLDIGCGEGWLCESLHEMGVDAWGVDVSSVAIERAEKRLPGRFAVASVLSMPYEDDSFDCAISTDMLEHLELRDIMPALAKIRRVISDMALVQVATIAERRPGVHKTVRPKEWWQRRLELAGFEILPCDFKPQKEWRAVFLLKKKPPNKDAAQWI